jgi:hypothetical protein
MEAADNALPAPELANGYHPSEGAASKGVRLGNRFTARKALLNAIDTTTVKPAGPRIRNNAE